MPEVAQRVRRRSPSGSSSTTATCRTWSSPSSAASCGCSRPAPASAPPRPRCASPSSMANEGLISRKEAVHRVTPEQVEFFLHPQFSPEAAAADHARSPPGSTSRPAPRRCVALDPDLAERWADEGRAGPAGASRDQARRRPRHARCGRHPHLQRRPHQPRRARRPPVRQAGRRRRRRARHRHDEPRR